MINFGIKKLQQVKYSHLICVPPAWVKTVNLHKGDDVQIIAGPNNELIIIPANVHQDHLAGNQTA